MSLKDNSSKLCGLRLGEKTGSTDPRTTKDQGLGAAAPVSDAINPFFHYTRLAGLRPECFI